MTQTQSANTTTPDHDGHRNGRRVDSFEAGVGSLAHGAVDAVQAGVADLRQGAQHAAQIARDTLDDAKGVVREKYQGARHAATGAAESVTATISRNPFTTIAIAAGVGFVVGFLTRRHRN